MLVLVLLLLLLIDFFFFLLLLFLLCQVESSAGGCGAAAPPHLDPQPSQGLQGGEEQGASREQRWRDAFPGLVGAATTQNGWMMKAKSALDRPTHSTKRRKKEQESLYKEHPKVLRRGKKYG